MTKMVIGIVFVLIGLIGIFKNKSPKFSGGLGYSAAMKFYLFFWWLFILGSALVISWINNI